METKVEKTPRSKEFKKKRARVILAVSTLLMALLGGFVLASNLTGAGQLVTVMTDSMSPAIPKGSLAVISNVPASSVREGDIVALGVSGDSKDIRVSRIDSITSTEGVYSYTLWADNTQLQDPWLHRTMGDLQVIVWSAPILGWFLLVIGNPVFLFIMLGAVVYFARYYTIEIFDYNRRQVHARRIAEERLENIKYGGLTDVVDMFEEHGGVIAKVGRGRPKLVSDNDALDELVREKSQEIRERYMKKLEKKYKTTLTEKEGEVALND